MGEQRSGEFRTAIITLFAGLISAGGTMGVAYFGGFFQVANTDAASRGTIDLEKLKFSNELVKTALASDNPANSLLFYNDIGLLAGLSSENVKSYAERETERLEKGGSGDSLLPSFDKAARPKLWLDRDFFTAFTPDAEPEVVDAIVSTGNYLLTGFGINGSSERLSAFLAEIAYETAGFRRFVESGNYSENRLLTVFPRYFDAQSASEYARDAERILNRVYADKLGNGPESSGDGWTFRGRGFLQLTGRENYQRYSDETGIDLVTSPDIIGNPHVAMLIACVVWSARDLNAIADQGDVAAVFRKLSGASSSGIAQRREFNSKASTLLAERLNSL